MFEPLIALALEHPLLFSFGLCIFVQIISWLWQIKTQNTDIVDISWTLLIVLCSSIYFISATGDEFHSSIILLIPIAWYARLAWHLIARYRVSHEDGRYQALRKHWKDAGSLQLKLLAFFIFQALLAWAFSYPAYIVANAVQSVTAWDIVALALLVIAFIGVTLSDWQLAQFKKQKPNAGKVCNQGLWRYSRHPNYFFEWLHWFCYPLLGLSSNLLFTIDGFILLASPFLMLLFLLKLTGIPFNEQQNIRSKGDAYRHYQRKTNKFFLGRPKFLEE